MVQYALPPAHKHYHVNIVLLNINTMDGGFIFLEECDMSVKYVSIQQSPTK